MKVNLQRTLRLGMLTVTIPLHSSHRMGDENSNQGEMKWNPVDDADPT